jgi:hypothetical protein
MESGDGGWIRAGGTQADEDAEYQARSAEGWPAVAAGSPAGPSIWPSTRTSAGNRRSHGGIPEFSAWVAAVVAVAAAAAGVVVGFFLVKGW